MADDLKLLIRIQADVKQALDEMRQVRASVEGTGASGRSAASGMRSMGQETSALRSKLERVRSSASGASGAFRDLRRVVLLAFAAREVIDFTRALVDANVEAQRIEYTLRAVTGSAAGARKEFQYVSDVSKRLGLDLASTAAGYARVAVSAKSAGLSQQQLHKAFEGLAETFTVLHTPAEDVNGLLVQLEQGLSLGKFQMQDFRAVAQHLPGTMELAKRAAADMGGSLQNMLQKGGVPAEQFFIRFTSLLHDTYGPEAKDAAHSLNAELNRLHTTIFGLETQRSGFVESFTGAVRDLNAELSDPSIQQGLENLISGLGKFINALVVGAAKLANFTEKVGEFAARITTGISDPNNQLQVTQHRLGQINDELDRLIARQKILQSQVGNAQPGPAKTALQGSLNSIQAHIAQLKHERVLMRQAESDLKKNGGTFGFVPPGTASGPKGGGKSPKLAPTVDAAAVRAQYDAQINLVKEKLSEQQQVLDAQRQQDLIGLRDYYAQKQQLQQKALDVEIAAKQKELAAAKKDTGKNALKNQEKLIGEINVLEQKRGFIARQSALQQAAAEKKVNDQLKQVRASLLQDEGRTAEASRIKIEQQYHSLLKQLELDSNSAGAALVKNLIKAEEIKSQLQVVRRQYDQVLSDFKLKQQQLQEQVSTGQMSEANGQQRINELYKRTASALDPLLNKMQRLAKATGNKQTIASIAQLREQLKLTGEQAQHTFASMDQFVVQAARSMEQNFSNFFFDAMQGKFDNLGQEFKRVLDRMVADALAAQLGKKLFGQGFASGKSSALGGWLGTAVKWASSFFHDGGIVGAGAGHQALIPASVFAGAPRLHTGATILKPDEVPAILQTGETVLPRGANARPSVHVTNNFTIHAPQGHVSRATQSQIAAAAGASVQRALARNR